MDFLFQPLNVWTYVVLAVVFTSAVNVIIGKVFPRNPIMVRINRIFIAPMAAVGLVSFLAGWASIPLWMGIVLTVILGGIGYFPPLYLAMRHFLVKDLNNVVAQTKDLAEERATVSQRIEIATRDELGEISHHINVFLGHMEKLALTLRKTSASGKNLGNDLSASAEEMNATLIEMERTLESLMGNIGKLDEEQKKSKRSITAISVETRNTNKAVEEQASWVEESSASVEEMAANIDNITRVTKDKHGLSDRLAEVARDGEKELAATLKSMEGISQSAGVIFDLIKIINSVAAQTNLLAMNAAIEAAHAGDAGRGFAVVADEIRKLAETTAGNSKNISHSLKVIMGQIGDTTKGTKKTAQRIASIFDGIEEVSASMRETLAGLQEINTGSRQIVQTFVNLNRLTHEVKSFSQNVSEKTGVAESASAQVDQLSEEARNGIGEVLIGVKEVRRAAGNLAQLSEKNAENIASLETLSRNFKAD